MKIWSHENTVRGWGLSFCRINETVLSCLWQGEFYHWVALFNYFDDFLERTVRGRSDLDLRFEDHQDPDPPFPTEGVVAVLHTTTIILENCANKHFWASYEVLPCFHVPTRSTASCLHCGFCRRLFTNKRPFRFLAALGALVGTGEQAGGASNASNFACLRSQMWECSVAVARVPTIGKPSCGPCARLGRQS